MVATAEVLWSALLKIACWLQMDFPILPGSHRILNVHQNVPGVLKNVNNIIADLNVNIKAQVRTARKLRPQGPPCHVMQARLGRSMHNAGHLYGSAVAHPCISESARSGTEFPDIVYMTQAWAWQHHILVLHLKQELILWA